MALSKIEVIPENTTKNQANHMESNGKSYYSSEDILGQDPEPETTKSSNNISDGDSGVSMATGDSKLNDSHPGTPFIQHDRDREEDIPSGVPVPPDGGWGWAVVFASFMIHIIADGITYSFGTFMNRLMEVFNEGRGSVSLIPSILVGVTLGVGPIASSLVNKFGCRAVTIGGAVIGAIGVGASAAATNVAILYLTIGVLTGLGFGLIYLPAIVGVSMYFEKRRAFATGIAVCGSGIGTFIMAPLTQELIERFDWEYTFLITAVIVLSCTFFGILFRPLTTADSQKLTSDLEDGSGTLPSIANDSSHRSIVKNQSFTRRQIEEPPEIFINGELIKDHDNEIVGKNKIPRAALSHPILSSLAPPKKPFLAYSSHSRIYEQQVINATKAHGQHTHNLHVNSGVMFRKDIFYGGSLYNIPEYKNNPSQYSRQVIAKQEAAITRIASAAVFDEDKGIIKEPTSKMCGCITVSAESAAAFKEMMDFSLLKDPIFILFVISNFMNCIGFNVPYVYTVDRAILMGLDEKDASYLLSIVGIANTIGRIVLGFLSDKEWVNRLYLYNIALTTCGLGIGLSNFCNTYTTQAIFCAVFGVTSGANVGLTSVVLVDLLGLDKLTNAFGLLLLFQGIASIMGPPIIGALYDSIGNYESGFYFAGSMIFFSGVILFFLPWIMRREAAKAAINANKIKYEEDDHITSSLKFSAKKKPRKRESSFQGGIDEEEDENEGQFNMRI